MKRKIALLNFSSIFEEEDFYKNFDYELINCKNIRGTYCLCDNNAKKELKDVINQLPIDAIHFIDSGNYHYISEIETDRISRDFILLVFDNHTDMYKTNFSEMTSCGSWILEDMMENKHLRETIIVGSSDTQMIEGKLLDKTKVISSHQYVSSESWNTYYNPLRLPIYISIDKDVLSSLEITTNWNQGDMKLDEVFNLISMIKEENEIIGVDICGEPFDNAPKEVIEKDNQINYLFSKYFIE